MQESYRFKVTGRVQGVGFRIATQRRALALGLLGWVRNCDDGSVEGLVQGPDPDDLERFRNGLLRGPPGARVDALQWQVQDGRAALGAFEIRR